MAGGYKVIYRDAHKRRGENYDRSTHSKAKAHELAEEAIKFSKKYKTKATVKVVKVRKSGGSSSNPFENFMKSANRSWM